MILITAMADIIRHRGPDGEGFFFAPGIGLGSRRLAIIDPTGSRQPMASEDGRFLIVHNGEISNFRVLRRELESGGTHFQTTGDTEVILKAYSQWGEKAFSRLEGMFAIAIWDNETRHLHLARDPFGIKPLYYAQIGEDLLFASEIKALFVHPRLSRIVDPLVVAGFLSFNNVFGPDSFWTGVKRCLPGEHLTWHDGMLQHFRYADIGCLEVEPFHGSFPEAASAFSGLLSQSIRDHLISDFPVGAALSSGLDSSAVAVTAAGLQTDSLPVFTGFFSSHPGRWFDERSGAQTVATHHRMEFTECPIRENDFADQFLQVAYHLEEPTLGSAAVSHFSVAREARKRVKVFLTGHGGDELFAGYPALKAAWLRENGFKRGFSRFWRSGHLDEWQRVLFFLIGGGFDPLPARGQLRLSSRSRLSRILSAPMHDLIEKAGGTDVIMQRSCPLPASVSLDSVTRWYLSTYLPPLLLQEDKTSMAFGLESRVPFCSTPLLRFALSLSGSIKLSGGRLKAVPRLAMANVLPPLFDRLPKRGFPTPLTAWLSGNLGRHWEQQWHSEVPEAVAWMFQKAGVIEEFAAFRTYGWRLPNAYAVAHRLYSLQIVAACAQAMCRIPTSEELLVPDRNALNLPGPFQLGRRGYPQSEIPGGERG
jgi:asparagine synthase (glutamine-hydrolysing)